MDFAVFCSMAQCPAEAYRGRLNRALFIWEVLSTIDRLRLQFYQDWFDYRVAPDQRPADDWSIRRL
jgi:hypothetical protein